LTGWLPTPAEPGPAGEPPTVLLMANFADLVGGGEESLLALAARLDRHRIRPVASVPAEGDVAERLRALGVPVTVLPLPPVRPWRAAGMAWTLSRLRVLLAGERVALVHAQGGRGALYAALAAPGRRAPAAEGAGRDAPRRGRGAAAGAAGPARGGGRRARGLRRPAQRRARAAAPLRHRRRTVAAGSVWTDPDRGDGLSRAGRRQRS